MDFDDHDEPEDEEMEEMTVASTYVTPAAVMGNSGRGGAALSGGKVGGVEDAAAVEGSGNRKGSGGGGRYRECLKNHAVGIGGHAVDGCGEFIAAGEEGTLDALRCAACGCHRNFHRKEPEAGAIIETGPASSYPPHHHHHPHHHQFSPYYRTPAGYLQHHQMAALAAAQQHQRPLALPSTSAGGGGGHSRDEGDDVSNPGMVVMGGAGFAMGVVGSGSGKKRFRTKFTQEQKDKMLGFAERVGWRIQKHDEAAVQEFCEETGVKRHVLKVWMHNNKHTLGKKP